MEITQIDHKISDREESEFWEAVGYELEAAQGKFPSWPVDPIHGAGIIVEEAGETMQAALQHVYDGKGQHKIEKEILQCATTCLRYWTFLRRTRP